VEFRMNESSYDEYEEVESPFASKASAKTPHRERLRTRKNVFNRPFATDSTHAPTYVETSVTRKSVAHADDNTELVQRRSSALHEAEIDYLEDEEEEEEVVEKLPVRRTNSSAKKKTKPKKNLLSKIGWSVIGILVLRLLT